MAEVSTKSPVLKRFLSNNPVEYKKAIQAAEAYVRKLDPEAAQWLYAKPFQNAPGNTEYFRLMYDLLNILKAMSLPHPARILEIGSGPGWITEILLLLGFTVDALEPSDELIRIAKERCSALTRHHQQNLLPRARFYQSTIEEIEFDENTFDGIICYDVLHHVVDEEKALAKAFRFLKPGGCLGIVEGAWHPKNKELEKQLIHEMEQFGTVENPFSIEYLDYLLDKSGFVDVKRYVPVNGFFSQEQLAHPLQTYGQSTIDDSNNLTAYKPMKEPKFPECYQSTFPTAANLRLISGGISRATEVASLSICLENTGETIWRSEPTRLGHVTIAMRRGSPGHESTLEAMRKPLPRTILPGEKVDLTLHFDLPHQACLDGWELDLVSEGVFWFSSCGTRPCSVPVL